MTLIRTPSFKNWTYTGSVKNASALGYLALGKESISPPKVQSSGKTPRLPSSSPRPQNQTGQCLIKVQSSAETPRLPNSSPRPQNHMGQKLIKDEPYSSEPSSPSSPTPTLKDWIGPSKLSDQKSHSHNSSHDMPPLVPFSSENPILQRKTPPPRLIPKPDPIQGTNMARSQLRSPNPFESPSSVPTKARSGLKRKATAESEHLMLSPNPMTKKSTDNLLCELCQVGCSSPLTMQQHLRGRAHKAKLEWMKLNRNTAGKRTGKPPTCDICQIWCSDRDGLEMHLKGQKHKAKLQELEICKKNGGEKVVDKRPILCELCGVHCMNGDLFMMHLKGKQHATRQEHKRRGY